MNIQKLFDTQKVLRDRIGYKGADRFEKLILALLVEIGECANEWRGFKFWSKDQEPRISKWELKKEYQHLHISQTGAYEYQLRDEYGNIVFDDVTDHHHDHKNPLLEEYVDGLHFVLEIGLEHGYDIDLRNQETFPEASKRKTITKQFTKLFSIKWERDIGYQNNYMQGLELYIGLGEMLGFTWEEIETAYFDKNKVNHVRQDTGY
ncbi:dUTP diphosphatase [Niallia sp. FSL W8-1348]|uniref:dUTP diphosphatase n=1 Tax=Niallia sp. FSL W8-1348 TaxID=2954656 RepID=UPI0030FB4C68